MTYEINDGTFDVSPIEDRTVNMLTLEYPNGPPLQLIVTRDAKLGGETLSDCLTRQLDVLARQMAGFKERARDAVSVGTAKLPGVALEIEFKQNGQNVHQCLAAVESPHPTKPDTTVLLMLVLSSVIPLNASIRATWQEILSGFSPRALSEDSPALGDAPRRG